MALFLTAALASLSLMLRQPLSSFCDLETTDGRAFISKGGHYLSWVRLDGMQRMAERADFEAVTEAMRLELSGALETKGHALVGWYMSDPQAALVEIERVNLNACRAVAREVGLQLDDILDERARVWPTQMRWEAAYLVVWTRTSVLTKEERKQLKADYAANAARLGALGSTQRTYLRSTVMAARHAAFVSRVMHSLRSQGVACAECESHDTLRVAREVMYRETASGDWRATLPGDRPMPRCPPDGKRATGEHLLWPTIGDQIFYTDAVTVGGHHVEFGENTVAPIDMTIGPEDPRPLVELVATLGRDRIPWRTSFLLEGCGPAAMSMKKDRRAVPCHVPRQRGSGACLRHARQSAPGGEPHRGQAPRQFCNLGAGRGSRTSASKRIDPRAARRSVGQLQDHHGHRRSARGRDEQCPRSRPGVDGKPVFGAVGRCAGLPAVEPDRLALGNRQRAVPPAGRRHLVL